MSTTPETAPPADRGELAVVVAAHEEAERIAATVTALRQAFPGAAIWVGDDASRDGTGERAMVAGAQVVTRRRPHGKGGNVTAACEAALSADPAVEGETFNISGGEMVPICDLVERVCSALSVPLRWKPVPFYPALLLARFAEMASLARPVPKEPVVTPYTLGLFAFRQSLDISKAQRMLGWQPRISLEHGLAMTLDRRRAP